MKYILLFILIIGIFVSTQVSGFSESSYTIYKNQTRYYSMSQDNNIQFSGSFSDVFNNSTLALKNTGGKIQLSNGTFYGNKQLLQFGDNITIEGLGKDITIIKRGNYTNAPLLRVDHSNVNVKDMTFDDSLGWNGSEIQAYLSNNSVFDSIKLIHFKGSAIGAGINTKITSSDFLGENNINYAKMGVWSDLPNSSIYVTDCNFYDMSLNAIYSGVQSYSTIIKDSYFKNNGIPQGGQIDIFSKVSMINNNYFDKGNTGSQGIELNINTNNSTSIIQGNYVTKNLYGIIIHSGNRAKLNIYGNMFDNVGEGIGIFNNATNYFIHGNYFSNDKYYSIWIQGTNNNGMVIGNFIN